MVSRRSSSAHEMVALIEPMPPGIDKKRYYFNNSHAASVSNLFMNKKGNTYNLNLVYYNDHERRNSTSQTIYMLPDNSRVVVDEGLYSAMTRDVVEGNLSYKTNKKRDYFSVNLLFGGEWRRGVGSVVTDDDIAQGTDIESLKLDNTLHWVKRWSETGGMEISSATSFNIKPQNLYVRPLLFESIFPSEHSYDGMHQYVKSHSFSTRNSGGLLSNIKLWGVTIDPMLVLNYSYDQLDSYLAPIPSINSDNPQLLNDTYHSHLDVGLDVRFSYSIKKFKAELNVPLRYHARRLKQHKQDNTLTRSDLFVSSSLSLGYLFSASNSLRLSYSTYYNTPSLSSLYGGYILCHTELSPDMMPT